MALLILIGILLTSNIFAYYYPVGVQTYSYNRPSYYAQYNYGYNSGNMNSIYSSQYSGIPHYAYTGSGALNYVRSNGRYNTIGWGPFVMDHNNHMYVNNALDEAYFRNPGLLEPRRMNNHQRFVTGMYITTFPY
ncbi:MAG: hypothetical protein KKF46_04260 [Nanoarchaeota archaeon]|nr:hypothetical protein [Nanoarchaeota archaeon]MBU1321549.1 hypothetical protein [Nanoarchaeota archaeon]MBU1596851.1 hypothetical protein [Nanoarchaeota archaeon]MBU2441195.1 hypothetical protein [Nanoarchaeota archaeon]